MALKIKLAPGDGHVAKLPRTSLAMFESLGLKSSTTIPGLYKMKVNGRICAKKLGRGPARWFSRLSGLPCRPASLNWTPRTHVEVQGEN